MSHMSNLLVLARSFEISKQSKITFRNNNDNDDYHNSPVVLIVWLGLLMLCLLSWKRISYSWKGNNTLWAVRALTFKPEGSVSALLHKSVGFFGLTSNFDMSRGVVRLKEECFYEFSNGHLAPVDVWERSSESAYVNGSKISWYRAQMLWHSYRLVIAYWRSFKSFELRKSPRITFNWLRMCGTSKFNF